MIRKSFLIHVKPGMAGEYKKRHNPVWPEMKEALEFYGVRNYSIFFHEPSGGLFGYMEIEDEELFGRIAESDVCRHWWEYMKEVLIGENVNDLTAKEEILQEVFHLD